MSIVDMINKNKKIMQFKSDVKEPEYISTGLISTNLLFSGKVKGGVRKGRMSMMAAPPQLGKSLIGLQTMANAQKKGMHCIYIDAERAYRPSLAASFGIDVDNLVILDTQNIIEIKHVLGQMIDSIPPEERENVFVFFDSWGPLVTTNNLDKATAGKDTQDMGATAKWKNELANIMLASHFTCFVINHVYDNIGGFGDIFTIPGGRKIIFNCDYVVMGASKSKERDSDREITGAVIKAKTFKSRDSKEHSTLEYRIKAEGGLDTWYGFLDLALEGGYVTKPKNGRYSRPCVEGDREWKELDIYCAEFWVPVFKNTDIADFLEGAFTLSRGGEMTSTAENLDDLI